jgi:hypothetical protein
MEGNPCREAASNALREGYNTAEVEETPLDKGIFYWNNKLTANAVIL